MLKEEEILLIVYSILTILVLAASVVLFFIVFQRRKNKLLLEKFETEKKFERELAQSQIEIQEQTLKNIAWELHDNVGQLLSVANMQLGMLLPQSEGTLKEQLLETKETIASSVLEIRTLSRTLNTEVVLNNGLVKSIQSELERFNRLNFLNASMEVKGEEVFLKNDAEIILFRITQEFFSNVIKHSKAKNLFVNLTYGSNKLSILLEDDGVGFDMDEKKGNSGLQNMNSRANLLKAECNLQSEKGKGTRLEIIYPY
ncbi:MAG: histidine kinase [Flavobacteriaceae bacterium]